MLSPLLLFIGFSLSCPEDPNCRMCLGTTCAMCFDAVIRAGSKTCDPKIALIPHCELYIPEQDRAICILCVPGYYLSGENKCERCPSGCAACTESKSELKTDGNFVEASSYCTACFDGLLAKNGVCGPEKAGDDKCEIPGPTGCTFCKEGYAINQADKCVPSPKGCQFVADSGACVQCRDGTYLSKSQTCIGEPKPVPDFGKSWFLQVLLTILALLLVLGLLVLVVFFCMKRRRENEDRAVLSQNDANEQLVDKQ